MGSEVSLSVSSFDLEMEREMKRKEVSQSGRHRRDRPSCIASLNITEARMSLARQVATVWYCRIGLQGLGATDVSLFRVSLKLT